jgi:hypothetical protein
MTGRPFSLVFLVPPWVIANIFYYWCTKKKQKNDLRLLAMAAKKNIDISDQGKFRQKMSLYLTSWHIFSQLEVGFITDFHSWSNCQFQMFCVFLSAVFTPMRNEPANLRQLWHSIHHLCRMMMDGMKYIFEVLYYPSYDSHIQKMQFWKSSKFLIWR